MHKIKLHFSKLTLFSLILKTYIINFFKKGENDQLYFRKSIIFVDNQATVRMSKNYKVTSKNHHVRRRWHFVRQGVQNNLFTLQWVPGKDQLADDCTKTQEHSKAFPHISRTLIKVSDKVKGYRGTTVGNR